MFVGFLDIDRDRKLFSDKLLWKMLRTRVNDENGSYSTNLKDVPKETPSVKKKGLNVASANSVKPQKCVDASSKSKAEQDPYDCPKENYVPSKDGIYIIFISSINF